MERTPLYLQQKHRLELLRDEAVELSGVAHRVFHAVNETLDRGGTVSIQQQMNFITSVYARMLKDWGVLENLQSHGASLRAPKMLKANL